MITSLKENQVFIFGSNLNGAHGAGAARQAHDDFGAEYGVGEGLTGQSYAFPTLDRNMQKVTPEALEVSRDKLFAFAQANSQLEFLLTKVGCGLAGFPKEEMQSLFDVVPDNIIKPNDWN